MKNKYKKSIEKKFSYLLKKWGFVEISRGVGYRPCFDSKGMEIVGQREAFLDGSCCCSNYSIRDNLYYQNGKIFLGERKCFCEHSIDKVIALAYKNERIGEQINLFEKAN